MKGDETLMHGRPQSKKLKTEPATKRIQYNKLSEAKKTIQSELQNINTEIGLIMGKYTRKINQLQKIEIQMKNGPNFQ